MFSALENGLDFSSTNATTFLAHSFPENSECLECKVLPICMGGCILKRVVEKQKSCSPVKFNMNDYINKRYQMSIENNVIDFGN